MEIFHLAFEKSGLFHFQPPEPWCRAVLSHQFVIQIYYHSFKAFSTHLNMQTICIAFCRRAPPQSIRVSANRFTTQSLKTFLAEFKWHHRHASTEWFMQFSKTPIAPTAVYSLDTNEWIEWATKNRSIFFFSFHFFFAVRIQHHVYRFKYNHSL